MTDRKSPPPGSWQARYDASVKAENERMERERRSMSFNERAFPGSASSPLQPLIAACMEQLAWFLNDRGKRRKNRKRRKGTA